MRTTKRGVAMNTFFRHNGLAVVVLETVSWSVCRGEWLRVRYCGPKGKAISKANFLVKISDLTPFLVDN